MPIDWDIIPNHKSVSKFLQIFSDSASSNLGNRFVSDYKPSPFEQAQQKIADIQEDRLEFDKQIQRNRLEQSIYEFRERMKAQRQDSIDRFTMQENYFDFSDWPLENYPHEIKSNLDSCEGNAILLFICVTESEHFNSPVKSSNHENQNKINSIQQSLLINDVRNLNKWITQKYPQTGNRKIIRSIVSQRSKHLNHNAMAMKLRHHFSTEPCIFVNIDANSLTHIPVHVSMWGMSGNTNKDVEQSSSFILDEMQELNVSSISDLNEQAYVRDFSLKSLIAGLIDLSFLTYRFDDPIQRLPTAPKTLSGDVPDTLKPHAEKLYASYHGMLELISTLEPLIAAETALDFVEHFQQQGMFSLAKYYFSTARNILAVHYRNNNAIASWHDTTMLPTMEAYEETAILERLRRCRSLFNDAPPETIAVSARSHRETLIDMANQLGPTPPEKRD